MFPRVTAPVARIAWPERKRKLTSGNSQASLESAMTRLFRERPVMAGLVPAIHVFDILEKSWMSATSAGMTIPGDSKVRKLSACV